MNAKHFEVEDFVFYLSGDLEDEQLATMTDHLHSCSRCQDALNDAAETLALVKNAPVPTVSMSPKGSSWWQSPTVMNLTRVAAVVLIFLSGMLVQKSFFEPSKRQIADDQPEKAEEPVIAHVPEVVNPRLVAAAKARSGSKNGFARGLLAFRALTH